VTSVSVEVINGWYCLSADGDWLPSDERGLRAFTQLLHLPEAGVNASRSEVLLTAFAKVVLTSRESEISVVVDHVSRASEGVEVFADSLAQSVRAIVFLA
jgi:hypothetical protein